MEPTTILRRTLWANVAFAEVSALAAIFMGSTWTAIDELTAGQHMLFGIELLAFAGMITYVAWKSTVSRRLIWTIVALNSLLLLYLIGRFEFTPSLSPMGKELIAIDALAVLMLIVLEVRGLRALASNAQVHLTS